MEEKVWRCVRSAVAIATLVLAPAARAADVTYDLVHCGSLKPIVLEARQGVYAQVMDYYDIVASSTNKDWAYATAHCGGYFRVADGKESSGGVCKWVLPSGDTAVMEWKGTGPGEGSVVFVSGTGKLKGVQGGGPWKIVSNAKPADEGTFQRCVHAWGKYSVPES